MYTLDSLKENKNILKAWDNYNQSLEKSGLLNDPTEYEYSPQDDIDPWEEEEQEREYLESVGCDCEGPCGYYGCQKPVDIDRVNDEVCVPENPAMLNWYWNYITQNSNKSILQRKRSRKNDSN
jgi:hypothetical protein